MATNKKETALAREMYQKFIDKHKFAGEEMTAACLTPFLVPELSVFHYAQLMCLVSTGQLRSTLPTNLPGFMATIATLFNATPLNTATNQAGTGPFARMVLLALDANNNLQPYDGGPYTVGVLVPPVQTARALEPRLLMQCGLTVSFGAQTTGLSLPGMTFSGTNSGKRTSAAACFERTAKSWAPMGSLSMPFGPMKPDVGLDRVDSFFSAIPVGETPYGDFTIYSTMPFAGTALAATTWLPGAGYHDIVHIRNVNTPKSVIAVDDRADFLFNINSPAKLHITLQFASSIVLAGPADNANISTFVSFSTPYIDSTGAPGVSSITYNFQEYYEPPSAATRMVDCVWSLNVPPFAKDIWIGRYVVSSTPGAGLITDGLFSLDVSFESCYPRPTPVFGALGLANSVLTLDQTAVLAFDPTVEDQLIFQKTPIDAAASELLDDIIGAMPAAAALADGLLRRVDERNTGVVIPGDALNPDGQLIKYSHPTEESHTFLAGLGSMLASALPTVLPMVGDLVSKVVSPPAQQSAGATAAGSGGSIGSAVVAALKSPAVRSMLRDLVLGVLDESTPAEEEYPASLPAVSQVATPMRPTRTPRKVVSAKTKRRGKVATFTVPVAKIELSSMMVMNGKLPAAGTYDASITIKPNGEYVLVSGVRNWSGMCSARPEEVFAFAGEFTVTPPIVSWEPLGRVMLAAKPGRRRLRKYKKTVPTPDEVAEEVPTQAHFSVVKYVDEHSNVMRDYCDLTTEEFCVDAGLAGSSWGVGQVSAKPGGTLWLLKKTKSPIRFVDSVLQRTVHYVLLGNVYVDDRLAKSFDSAFLDVERVFTKAEHCYLTSLCSLDDAHYVHHATGGSLVAAAMAVVLDVPLPRNDVLTGSPFLGPKGPVYPGMLCDKTLFLLRLGSGEANAGHIRVPGGVVFRLIPVIGERHLGTPAEVRKLLKKLGESVAGV
jgi:hypothetical protein